MDVIRFALGFRFDAADDSTGRDEREYAFSELFSRLDPSLTEGMKVYAGHFAIDENDDERIYTIITMGKGLKRTKALYRAAVNDPALMCLLTDHRPIIQTNVIFKIEGFDYFGEFDKDGNLTGGDVDFSFRRLSQSRLDQELYPLRIVLAPDKFKGSMTQFEVVDVLKSAARKILPGCRLISAPVADGGDGTAEVLCRLLNGIRRKATVTGPDWNNTDTEYCFISDDTAMLDMASASGLSLVRGKPDPMDATSRGTGELILDAVKNGARKLYIGLGGSATNDCGIGAAVALGVKFKDEVDNEFAGCASNMESIRKIDLSGVDPIMKDVQITLLSDVTNPLTGPNGATAVFGPQKGANEIQLIDLERGMKNLECRYNAIAGRDIGSLAGSGAAGGMGAMLMALFNAKVENGAKRVLETMNLDKLIRKADVVVTGEGKFDRGSIDAGKATGEVIRCASNAGAVLVVISGCLGEGWERVFDIADANVYSTVTGAEARLMESDKERLFSAAERAFMAVKTGFKARSRN